MEKIYDTKAEIVKGLSKSGNVYYGFKIWINNEYAYFDVLQNADRELVKNMEQKLVLNNQNE